MFHTLKVIITILFGLPTVLSDLNGITTENNETTTGYGTNMVHSNSGMNSDCLSTVDLQQTRNQLKTLLDEGNKLIFIKYELLDLNSYRFPNDTYQPFNFIYSTSKYGRRLLLLRTNFQLLSLGLLSYDTKSLSIKMKENDPNCLNRMSSRILQNSLRKMILNKFQKEPNQTITKTEVKVCNLFIAHNDKWAEFRHTCCYLKRKSVMKCQEEKKDTLVKSLEVIIYILQILAFLFCPLIVPRHWYKSKALFSEYVLNLRQPLEVRAMKDGEHYFLGAGRYVRLSKVRIRVKEHELISANSIPVGLRETLYKNFVLCDIRNEPVFKDCCYGNLCGDWNAGTCEFKWFKCCQMFVLILYLNVLLIPVVIWLIEFYLFENDEYQSRVLASKSRGLFYAYDGSISTLPINHKIFISALIILFTVLIIFSMFISISKRFGTTFYQVPISLFYKSFLAMFEDQSSRNNIYRGAFISIIWPFQRYGIFAVIFVMVYWCLAIPIILVILISTTVPLLNLVFRILGWSLNTLSPNCTKMFYTCLEMAVVKLKIRRSIFDTTPTDPDFQSKDSLLLRILNGFYALLGLFVLFLGLLVLLECIGFYVTIIVYTIVGLIVNVTKTLKFIIVFLMIVLHARDCFSGISDIYTNFQQKLIEILQEYCQDEVEGTTIAKPTNQVNTAFQVPSISKDDDKNSVKFHKANDGEVQFKIKRMPLLINNLDVPYMTEKFFSDACNMGYFGCPGPLLPHFLNALWHLLTIVIFLFLIIFILLIFGEETISSANQTLITLVGGLLPFVFRRVLFQRRQYSDFDRNNLNFKNGLKNMIEEFVQVFPASKPYVLSEDLYEIPHTEAELDRNDKEEVNVELHNLNEIDDKADQAMIIETSEDRV